MASRSTRRRPPPPPLRWWIAGFAALGLGIGPGCRALPARGAKVPAVAVPPGRSSGQRDAAVEPANHHARLPDRVPALPDGEPEPPDGVLTLPAAIAYGLRHNPRLIQAAAQVRAAREGETIAFAPFLPEANFNYIFAGFNKPILPGGNFVPASLQSGVYSFSLAELGIQYTMLDFGRRGGRYDKAVSQVRAAELFLRRAQQTVAFDVATAYFALLQARAQEKVLVEAVERSTAFRRDAGSQREGGTAEQETLFRSDVQVSQASEQLAAGRQAVLDAEALLNQALGRACPGPIEVVDVLRRPQCDDPREACLARAARTRPEIGAARQEIVGAGGTVRSARGELLPFVYVSGTAIQADLQSNFNGIIDGLGVNLEQTLYAGGRKFAGVRQAEDNAVAAAAGLRVILNNVSAQVNLAFNALGTNRERIRLNAVAVRQARENLRVVLVRFRNGDAIPTDVLNAETAVTGAEVGYYDAVYGFLANQARLEYAQGNDLDALVAAALAPPGSPDERIAAPLDGPGEAPIPPGSAPPGAREPGPPGVPTDANLPPALPPST